MCWYMQENYSLQFTISELGDPTAKVILFSHDIANWSMMELCMWYIVRLKTFNWLISMLSFIKRAKRISSIIILELSPPGFEKKPK